MKSIMIERQLSKAQYCIFMTNLPFRQIIKNILLTLCQLTTRHLVTRLHCNLVACQQLAHVTSHNFVLKRGIFR